MDVGALWRNFFDIVQNHYMDFYGRVGRPQFWYFVLISFALFCAAAILDVATGLLLFGPIVALGLSLPTAGMIARRIHDLGRSTELVWVWVILGGMFWVTAIAGGLAGPFGMLGLLYIFLMVGWLMMLAYIALSFFIIYFCVQPGAPEPNQYGPPPAIFNPLPATI